MQQNAVIRKKYLKVVKYLSRQKKLNYFVILKEDFYGLT
jgi:hypothetical protein